MKKAIVAVLMLAVLMVGSVAGAKGGVKGQEHGTIDLYEHSTILPW